jgi:diphthine-ammonia ligase
LLKRAVALYTGGKDSHFAILEALKQGVLVDTLVIVRPAKKDSWMFHTVNIEWASLHAKLMGLKSLEVKVSGEAEKEVKELGEVLKERLKNSCYDFIVSGAVASKYQKERVDCLADELGLKHLAPLWGRDQSDLLKEEVGGLGVIVTAV